MRNLFVYWWCSTKPKAKWLTICTAIYAIIGAIVLAMDKADDYLVMVQMVWLFAISMPLWVAPLAKRLDMKPRLLDWLKQFKRE